MRYKIKELTNLLIENGVEFKIYDLTQNGGEICAEFAGRHHLEISIYDDPDPETTIYLEETYRDEEKREWCMDSAEFIQKFEQYLSWRQIGECTAFYDSCNEPVEDTFMIDIAAYMNDDREFVIKYNPETRQLIIGNEKSSVTYKIRKVE